MSADIIEISAATSAAQAVLQLVADKLRTSDTLAADEVATLFTAVSLAIERLDLVHECLHPMDEVVVAQPVEGAPQ